VTLEEMVFKIKVYISMIPTLMRILLANIREHPQHSLVALEQKMTNFTIILKFQTTLVAYISSFTFRVSTLEDSQSIMEELGYN
jgi:hypothetical protein